MDDDVQNAPYDDPEEDPQPEDDDPEPAAGCARVVGPGSEADRVSPHHYGQLRPYDHFIGVGNMLFYLFHYLIVGFGVFPFMQAFCDCTDALSFLNYCCPTPFHLLYSFFGFKRSRAKLFLPCMCPLINV